MLKYAYKRSDFFDKVINSVLIIPPGTSDAAR
jgi:hypothetical protein